ncbi:hypothetical protein [Leifsonia sp. ALI-44-B]|uniref:hypothetical protein n=1 Tax=Leifsonia sp. ALI-44-B TaxID=1933776 RepID=UPI00117AFCFB|nr:hypothetical protein [Leifsonia sp. ALI-44-B]
MMKRLAEALDLDAAADFLEAHGQAGGLTEEQTVLSVARLRQDADEARMWADRRERKRLWRAEYGTATQRLEAFNRGKTS